MSNIQEIDNDIGAIIRVIHSSKDDIEPFSKDIFLIEVNVAGTSYHSYKYEHIVNELVKGTKLDLYREANNEYNENAILVKYKGIKLGYIPRESNTVLANLMDGGKLIYGVVCYHEYHESIFSDKWLQIRFRIFLKD